MPDSSIERRTATVLLYQGRDRERMEELLAEVEGSTADAVTGPTARMSDVDEGIAEAVEAYNAFLPEAKERAVKVVVQAIGGRRWRQLRADHTKRDAEGGPELDTESFADALLTFDVGEGRARMRTIVQPEFDDAAGLDGWIDALSDADYERVFTAAYAVNYSAGVVDPKGLNVSELMATSDETLN